MKVEIWSDVMCPFCYIGKRHFEKALAELPFKSEVELEWKSFQLNPTYENSNNEDLYTYLARSKGMSVAQAQQMTGQVVAMAKNAGLEIDFGKNIPANSFKAHQLLHLAKNEKLQNEAEEALFEAHFIEGLDISKEDVLINIGEMLGIVSSKIMDALRTDKYTEAVRYDVYESQQLGISGVPYFVFDRKYALSGAQPIETFGSALTQSYNEWKANQPLTKPISLNVDNENVCGEDGCVI